MAIGWSLAITLLALSVDHPWIFPIDDAYITLHNARALWHGTDPSFGSPALYGATSPVHLLLVAGMQALAPPVAGQFLLSVAALAAYLCGVAAMAMEAKAADWRLIPIFAAATLGGSTMLQLFDGLEGGLACAAIVWAAVLAARPPTTFLALLCGVLPFIRPELALLGLILLGRQAMARRRMGGGWLPIAIDIGVAAAAAAPFLAWNLATFGSLLPNTIHAKAAYFANDFPAKTNLKIVLESSAAALGPTLLAVILAPRSDLKYALLLFVGLFYLGYGLALPAALTWADGVYLLPLLAVGIWGLCRLSSRPKLFMAFAVLTIGWTLHSLEGGLTDIVRRRAQIADGIAAGRWIGENLPPSAVILTHDDGALAEGNRAHLVDAVGLKTPWVAAVHERLTGPSHGAQRGDAVDLIARQAKVGYVVALNDETGFWRSTATNLAKHGWTLKSVRQRETPNGYDIFSITPPASTLK